MDERKAHILDLVTEQYIHSARPVPSSTIAKRTGVSSATVRNEFSALEHAGYLQQPHTSAGRIPTARGFDHYARKFIPPRRLPEPQKHLLEERLRGAHGDSLLRQVADITAELSGYAVVVSLPADDQLLTLEIHLSALSTSRMLAMVVLENGLIRQLMVEIDPPPSERALREAESSLRQLTLPVGEIPRALDDIAKRAQEEVAHTFHALARAWPNMNPPRVFSQGLKNLLSEPESSDPEFVRTVVSRLEHSSAVSVDNLEEALALILEEALATVSTRLDWGSTRGGLMLLGPLRMRYPETLMIVQGVSEVVSQSQQDEASLN